LPTGSRDLGALLPHSFLASFGCVVKAKCEHFKHDREIKEETRDLYKIHLEMTRVKVQKTFYKGFKLNQHSGISMSFN